MKAADKESMSRAAEAAALWGNRKTSGLKPGPITKARTKAKARAKAKSRRVWGYVGRGSRRCG